MKIPSLLLGRAGQVETRVRKVAASIIDAKCFADFDLGPLVDTATVSGMILVDQESSPSNEPHFHCYMLSSGLADASPQAEIRKNLNEWLTGSLDTQWRFMCTLGGEAWLGLDQSEPVFARLYVEAAIRHWSAMKLENHRFGPPLDGQSDVLRYWRTLFFAVGKLGLPAKERMKTPGLEPRALLDLVDKWNTTK
jgi:hypothetical protein